MSKELCNVDLFRGMKKKEYGLTQIKSKCMFRGQDNITCTYINPEFINALTSFLDRGVL